MLSIFWEIWCYLFFNYHSLSYMRTVHSSQVKHLRRQSPQIRFRKFGSALDMRHSVTLQNEIIKRLVKMLGAIQMDIEIEIRSFQKPICNNYHEVQNYPPAFLVFCRQVPPSGKYYACINTTEGLDLILDSIDKQVENLSIPSDVSSSQR